VMLGARADIGINIFPTYRGGESAYIFEKFAAAFHHHFGARKFVMRRYQVGWQNPEGVQAGSYWFYYKLGFRSIDAGVRVLADRERARLVRTPGGRSGPAVLKRLARSDLVLCTDGTDAADFRDIDPKTTGLAVTQRITARFGGDRARALREMARHVVRALGHGGAGGDVSPVRPSRSALAPGPWHLAPVTPWRLLPVVSLIPRLASWTPAERRGLLALLRAKEARRERGFVIALQRHPRFLGFLRRLSAAQSRRPE